MADVRHFVVLGLGSFGTALATRLSKNGCRVTGVDSSQERVDALKDLLYEAVVADTTDRDALAELGISKAEAVFISLGEDLAPSLLATLHARELGAKRIQVKGVTEEHGKILRSLGVDRVIFPEVEIANEIADRATWPNVLDFLPIDSEYSFVEIAVPSGLSGETLRDADLRRRFGIWVLGVKDALSGKLAIIPDADFRLTDDQLLLVIGRMPDINKFRALK
jgi:trk system potassium uptake protein